MQLVSCDPGTVDCRWHCRWAAAVRAVGGSEHLKRVLSFLHTLKVKTQNGYISKGEIKERCQSWLLLTALRALTKVLGTVISFVISPSSEHGAAWHLPHICYANNETLQQL